MRRPEAAHRVQVEWSRLSPETTHTWLPPVSTGGVRPLTEPRFVVTFISVKFAGMYQAGLHRQDGDAVTPPSHPHDLGRSRGQEELNYGAQPSTCAPMR